MSAVTLGPLFQSAGVPWDIKKVTSLLGEGWEEMPRPSFEECRHLTDRVSDRPAELLAALFGPASIAVNAEAAPTTRSPSTSAPQLVGLGTITSARIPWLWEGRLPLGSPSLLVGPSGVGKSTLVGEVVSSVTRGELAGDVQGPASVVILSREDDAGAVLKPRLEAAGADTDLVSILPLSSSWTASEQGFLALEAEVARVEAVRLVVFDPLAAFLPSGIDSHKNASLRLALGALANFASASHTSVLSVHHVNKSQTQTVVQASSGSHAFVDASRSVLYFGPRPGDSDPASRYLFHAKTNYGAKAPTLHYRLSTRELVLEDGHTSEQPFLEAIGASTVTEAELLGSSGSSQRAKAVELLKDVLAGGPTPSSEIEALASGRGISQRTLKRARKELGVESTKRSDGTWTASLPIGKE